MDMPTTTAPGRRAAAKHQMLTRIVDELIALLAEGGETTHDRVAERAGVGRRTVYRYFPDRESMMQAAWDEVTRRAGPLVTMPESEADLLDTLQPIHEGFDAIAPLATIVRATPQGRAVRLSQKARRQRSYRAATADATKALPPEDRLLATAMLQGLHTSLWLEMHDHWDLTGTQTAAAARWAISVLLADLRARGARPLSEGPMLSPVA